MSSITFLDTIILLKSHLALMISPKSTNDSQTSSPITLGNTSKIPKKIIKISTWVNTLIHHTFIYIWH